CFGLLTGRNHPRLHRRELALGDGVLVLDPVVLEIAVLVMRDVLEREENRRLLDVRVGAIAPDDVIGRRVRAEPLAALSVVAAPENAREVGRIAGCAATATAASAPKPAASTACSGRYPGRCRSGAIRGAHPRGRGDRRQLARTPGGAGASGAVALHFV